jgi:hypothetical protein
MASSSNYKKVQPKEVRALLLLLHLPATNPPHALTCVSNQVPRKNPHITPETKYWKNLGKPIFHTCPVRFNTRHCKARELHCAHAD